MARSTPLVLVVDDNEAARFARVQTLARAGFRVIEVATGSDALRVCDEEQPDLVILDVNLPDISGLEVAPRLKARRRPAVQVLHLSNTAVTVADRVSGLEHGADAYLTEPVDATVLIATARALLRAREAEIALADALAREREARRIAEEADRLKDEFLAKLSHELRTPLNAIMGWMWQLRRSQLDDEARMRALESIERNTRVQAQLINDLLDVSRAVQGKLEINRALVDVEAVVTGAVETAAARASARGVTFDVSTEPVFVSGDAQRLEQVVGNLLSNAIQFSAEGGEVAVEVVRSGFEAVIRVRDFGAGIDADFLPHVFEQFRQADGGLSRQHGGLGLGLTIVRQLVELHGGRVEVESGGAGRGAAFTVHLPLADPSTSQSEQPVGSKSHSDP